MKDGIYSNRTRRAKERLQIEQRFEILEPVREHVISVLEKIIEPKEWKYIWKNFCNEKGKNQKERNTSHDTQYEFNSEHELKAYQSFCHKKIKEGTIEDIFDLVEIAFQLPDDMLWTLQNKGTKWKKKKSEHKRAIEEINIGFEEEHVGYRITNKRVERNVISLDISLPALDVLHDKIFKRARDNFHLAYQHYQDKNYEDCVVSSNKAFESFLKALCERQELEYQTNAPIGDLVKILCNNLLSNDKFNNKFPGYFNFLPCVRAHFGGHGFAPRVEKTHACIARYALHLAATNILFFMQIVELKNNQHRR